MMMNNSNGSSNTSNHNSDFDRHLQYEFPAMPATTLTGSYGGDSISVGPGEIEFHYQHTTNITNGGPLTDGIDPLNFDISNSENLTTGSVTERKFRLYPSKWVFVTFQKEGIHKFPGASGLPGVEFLQYDHRHMFHFRVEIQVFHDDREIEFILFKRELLKLYDEATLELNYKSCEMMSDDLAKYITGHYPGRFLKIEVSEDGENGAVMYYSGDVE
jgi:hypothetical protein